MAQQDEKFETAAVEVRQTIDAQGRGEIEVTARGPAGTPDALTIVGLLTMGTATVMSPEWAEAQGEED